MSGMLVTPVLAQEEAEYEVDYEEETSEAPDLTPSPTPKSDVKRIKKGQSSQKSSDPMVTQQGSRAINRFQLPVSADRKSVYKKNGKALDVDSD